MEKMNGDMSVKANVFMEQIDIDKFARELAQSQFCPANYRDKPLDIKFAILWGAEVGLSAFQSITGIKVINGKPTLYGDIFLAVCKKNPEWEDMIETYDAKTETAFCEARRKGHTPLIRSFSYAQAQQAKLIKPNSPWVSYKERMLQHRARGFALRDAYADSLCGMIDDTEANDYPVKDVTPAPQQIEGPDFEADHHVANIGQYYLHQDNRSAAQLAKDMAPALKKRVWARLSADEKEFIKQSIEVKKEVTDV